MRTPLPTPRGHRGLQRRGQGLHGRGRQPWLNPPSVSGSSAPNKGPSPAGHRLEASCPHGYCHLRASRTESPARSHSPGAQPPRGTCSGTCAPQAAPEWGTRRSPDGRRKAQETGVVSAATSSEDGGEVMGATRGGDAAISVPGSGSPQRAKATERAQAGTPGRHPGTSPARSDADFTRPRPPPRTSCAGGRLRAPEAPVPETREGCPRAGGTQASSGTRTRASDVPQQHEEKDGCRGPAGGMRSKAAVRVCVWVCLCECTCVVCVHM